jgi:hypothetical protein
MSASKCLLFAACCFANSGLAANVILQLNPSSQPVSSGDSVPLVLSVTGLGNPPSVGSFSIDIGFDSNLLSPQSVDFGNSLGDPTLSEALTSSLFGTGDVNVAEVSLLPNTTLDSLQTPAITLATINFLALGSGLAEFTYLGGPVDDGNGNLIFGTKTEIPEPATALGASLALVVLLLCSARRSGFGMRLASAILVSGTVFATNPGFTPPPNRDGAKRGDNESCPPGPDSTTKGTPDMKLGDMNVAGHPVDPAHPEKTLLDFFMGSWKFVDADGNDVVVKKWCINGGPPTNGTFHDFFSFEILTSQKGGGEVQKIVPTTPT